MKHKIIHQIFLPAIIQIEKLYVILTRILVFLAFYKPWRNKLKSRLPGPLVFFFNLQETLKYSEKNDKSFFDYEIKNKSILMVEPNSYHGILLPGFVEYCQDLGYNVDLFIRHNVFQKNPFCRTPKNQMPRIFVGTLKHFKKVLRLPKINQYEFLFLSSAIVKVSLLIPFLSYLGFEPRTKYGLLMVQHGVSDIKEFGQKKYLEEDRMFTLSQFYYNNHKLKMINPHYFGNIKIAPKSADKTRFIVVGSTSRRCRNHDLLIDTVQQLIHNEINNFEIILIGSGKLSIPDNLNKYMIFKGYLNFPDMFQEIEQADFFLSLLDPTIKYHKKYLNNRITGSTLLILGFLKPTLISKDFANFYDFTENNSIIYSDNNLCNAMLKAINLPSIEYQEMQNNLKQLSDKIKTKSLNNLAEIIRKLEKGFAGK